MRALQRVPQLVELEWLGDEVGGPAFDDLHRVLHGAVPCHHDADDVGVAIHRRLDHAGSSEAGQPQVGHDDVEREIGQQLERTLA